MKGLDFYETLCYNNIELNRNFSKAQIWQSTHLRSLLIAQVC